MHLFWFQMVSGHGLVFLHGCFVLPFGFSVVFQQGQYCDF